MTDNIKALIADINAYNLSCENSIIINQNEPLSRHTTFRIGGLADLYFIPQNVKSLAYLCELLKKADIRTFFLGNGSNVLFDDTGFRGAVVSTSKLSGISVEKNCIFAESGALLSSVCKTARNNGLSNMEFAYGIPGSVGGAVFMNAGAYGGEMSDIVLESTYLDLSDLTIHTISKDEHNFGYRDSIYRHSNFLILSSKFSLEYGNTSEIAEKMNDYMNRRIHKQPLDYPSAGSVFKRCPGRFTGQMIEESGLKGYSIGGAKISEKHAGFIINTGNATSSDVLALIEYIKETIYKNYGCNLCCEMIYVK